MWFCTKISLWAHSLQTQIHLPPCLQNYCSKTPDHLSVLIKTHAFLPSLNSWVQYRSTLSWRGESSRRRACRGGKSCPQRSWRGIQKPGELLKKSPSRTFLAVQWLRLCTSNAGAQVQSLVGELRSHIFCVVASKERNPFPRPLREPGNSSFP